MVCRMCFGLCTRNSLRRSIQTEPAHQSLACCASSLTCASCCDCMQHTSPEELAHYPTLLKQRLTLRHSSPCCNLNSRWKLLKYFICGSISTSLGSVQVNVVQGMPWIKKNGTLFPWNRVNTLKLPDWVVTVWLLTTTRCLCKLELKFSAPLCQLEINAWLLARNCLGCGRYAPNMYMLCFRFFHLESFNSGCTNCPPHFWRATSHLFCIDFTQRASQHLRESPDECGPRHHAMG